MTQDDIPGVMGAPGGPGGRHGAPGGSRLPPTPKREIKQQNNGPKSWFKVPKVCPDPKGVVFISNIYATKCPKSPNKHIFVMDLRFTVLIKVCKSLNQSPTHAYTNYTLVVYYIAVNVEHRQRPDCFWGRISLTESLSSFMQINCVRPYRPDFSTSLASRFCSGMGFCRIKIRKMKLSVTSYFPFSLSSQHQTKNCILASGKSFPVPSECYLQ